MRVLVQSCCVDRRPPFCDEHQTHPGEPLFLVHVPIDIDWSCVARIFWVRILMKILREPLILYRILSVREYLF